MLSRLNSERLIGGVITLFGLYYALQAYGTLDLGTFRRIGPGMFPLGLGIALTMLGLGIAILTPDADRDNPDFSLRPFVMVLAAVCTFAVAIAFLGLFPAIILCVFIASLAERPFRPMAPLSVSAVLCFAAWLIFRVGLGLAVPLAKWPF